jgi:hypothetical protein
MVGIMDKYELCLDLRNLRVKNKESDIFPLLNPTLPYSNTPALRLQPALASGS